LLHFLICTSSASLALKSHLSPEAQNKSGLLTPL
jgi:hypothetical protein